MKSGAIVFLAHSSLWAQCEVFYFRVTDGDIGEWSSHEWDVLRWHTPAFHVAVPHQGVGYVPLHLGTVIQPHQYHIGCQSLKSGLSHFSVQSITAVMLCATKLWIIVQSSNIWLLKRSVICTWRLLSK